MSSLSERMATLRENAKKEAESIAQEQDSAIETLRKRWEQRTSGELSAIDRSFHELSERITAGTKEAASGMVRAQRAVIRLWGRTAVALWAWVALVLLLAAGTMYFGRAARTEWARYAAVKEARERIESEAAIIVDGTGQRWARIDLSQHETMPSQKRPGRIYVLAENVSGSHYVRVGKR